MSSRLVRKPEGMKCGVIQKLDQSNLDFSAYYTTAIAMNLKEQPRQ